MSDAVAIQLMVSVVTLLGLLISAGVTIWQLRSARAEVVKTAEAVKVVEATVNGKHTEALKVIERLEGHIRQLNADPTMGTTPTTRGEPASDVTMTQDGTGIVSVTNGEEGK